MTRRLRPYLALFAAVVVACQASSPPSPVAPGASGVIRTLAVVVTMPASAPVVGASVCAFTMVGAREGCGETSASGTARLGLRPGPYSIVVTPQAPTRLA